MEPVSIVTSLVLAALICLLARCRSAAELVSMGAAAIVLAESVVVALKVAAQGVYAPFRWCSVDALGAIVMLIIAFVGLAATFYSLFYLREETAKKIVGFRRVRQYFVLLNLFLAAMFLAVTASSPIVTWIAIEATTLSTAFLISFYNKPAAMEAAWKYLIVNSVGLLLGFLGTLLYFTSTQSPGGGGFVTWDALASNVGHLDPRIARIAFVFVLIGYGTKVGLVPMHTWLPDAHSKAPAPLSALLSGVLLNVALVAVLRFKLVTDTALGQAFSQRLLLLFGVLSIAIAALIILTQKNYKRLLAYSSIENMGIMTLGFGFGGLGAYAAVLHMIYHSLAKSALFFSAGNILLKYSSTKISNVRGAISTLPFTGVLFLVGFLAVTGTPPFGLFLTKVYILSEGMKTHLAVTVVAMCSFVVLFAGFLKHATSMVFGEKPDGMEEGEADGWLAAPPLVMVVLALCLSFYIPEFLHTLVVNAAARYL